MDTFESYKIKEKVSSITFDNVVFLCLEVD
jgi:hypothetical protein